jgi:uncharacterized membrane protein
MTKRLFRAAAAGLLCATLGAGASAQIATSITYNYTNVVYPGAMLTSANGINNSNVIVGSFLDSASSIHGFVYRYGRYTAVNFPGATATEALGINDFGDIVGMYQVPGPLNFHGFLRHNGKFTSIDTPAAEFGTKAFGINKDGTIVGSYDDAHGFVYQGGVYRTLDVPQLPGETANTQLNGVSNLGWIVGQVFTGGAWRGFWMVGDKFGFLGPVGAADGQITGANGRGDIVGCHDAMSGFVSFNLQIPKGRAGAGRFPAQQRLVSCASAINYARVVMGSYFTVNQPKGFLAVPALTLNVVSPANHASLINPVHLVATASGNNPISQIQVWVNFKKVFHSKGATLNAVVNLPVGTNERFAIHAIDSKGLRAKVVDTITVH